MRHLKAYNLNDEDTLLVTLFCHLLINRDDDDIRFNQMEDVYESNSFFYNAKAELRSGEHWLMKKISSSTAVRTASPTTPVTN